MARVYVVGGGGSGKTTVAARLAPALGAPLISLDAVLAPAGRPWEAEQAPRAAALARLARGAGVGGRWRLPRLGRGDSRPRPTSTGSPVTMPTSAVTRPGADRIDLYLTPPATNTTRHFATAVALCQDAEDAPVWGGIHSRFADVAGDRDGCARRRLGARPLLPAHPALGAVGTGGRRPEPPGPHRARPGGRFRMVWPSGRFSLIPVTERQGRRMTNSGHGAPGVGRSPPEPSRPATAPELPGRRAFAGRRGGTPRCATIHAATPARDGAPSFARMCLRWSSAVYSLMPRVTAIWRFVRPSATSTATSRSPGAGERRRLPGPSGRPCPEGGLQGRVEGQRPTLRQHRGEAAPPSRARSVAACRPYRARSHASRRAPRRSTCASRPPGGGLPGAPRPARRPPPPGPRGTGPPPAVGPAYGSRPGSAGTDPPPGPRRPAGGTRGPGWPAWWRGRAVRPPAGAAAAPRGRGRPPARGHRGTGAPPRARSASTPRARARPAGATTRGTRAAAGRRRRGRRARGPRERAAPGCAPGGGRSRRPSRRATASAR